MTKEELIRHIQEGIKKEESAVAIYSKHLSAIISRSGLAEPDISNIKSKLETLIQSTRRHKNILTSLVQQIKGESIDVY